MRLMMLLLVILLSDEELFWKEQGTYLGGISRCCCGHTDTSNTLWWNVCTYNTRSGTCALIKVNIHKHGHLLMHWWTRLQLGQAVKTPEGLFSHVTTTLFLLPSLLSLCFYFVTDVLASVLLLWPLAGYFSSSDTLRRKNKYHIYSAGS